MTAATTHVFVLRHGDDVDRCIGDDGTADPHSVVVLLDEVHVPGGTRQAGIFPARYDG